MACCRGCRPTPVYDYFPSLLLILAVISMLLFIPRLFPVIELRTREPINWVLIVAPLLLLAIVHWLSSMTRQDMYYPAPPCKRCHRCPCKGCLPWGVAC
ncbi:hypothetical protein I3843_05G068600 [Carya illinoinensis]|uniref:Uncharacterized protein n=1 Tax=Carya illinoinensis TaxID=32201 RepID=A0A8T1QFY6_CARIL|nr:hypothetical protein I3760_05G076600 [Carya illinoinensis]KAG6653438.1 hypothetical protein CIPAW_05G076700 [Carya illinoinensis]KAG6711847.1 hypothetical protein I3842_05G075300 [Carya illinoinensis]KAG7978152.1 hypothetical protein I3843_05G068600 [Carya illinoinensis]